MKSVTWLDYVIAYPFALPFWLWTFLYPFSNSSSTSWLNVLLPALYFLLWLRLWLESLTRILEAESVKTCAEEERKELAPCIRLKQHAVIPN